MPSHHRSRSRSPRRSDDATRVFVHSQGDRPSSRTHRPGSRYSDRSRRRSYSRSYSPSRRRRRPDYDDQDEDRDRSPHSPRRRRRPDYDDRDGGRGRSPSRSHSPQLPVVIHTQDQPSLPAMMPSTGPQHPIIIAPPRSRSRSRSSSPRPPIILQQPTVPQQMPSFIPVDPMHQAPTQPITIIPPPAQQPTMYSLPPTAYEQDPGVGRGPSYRTHGSYSPPPIPTSAPTQHIVHEISEPRRVHESPVHGRSRSRSPRRPREHDDGDRSPRPRRHDTRLPTYDEGDRSPRRSRRRAYEGDPHRTRGRGSRSLTPEEGDPRHTRRRRSRSPYDDREHRAPRRRGSRSPISEEGDPHHTRRRRSRSPYDDREHHAPRRRGSRSPISEEGDPHHTRRRRSRSPYDDREHRAPRRRGSRSPTGIEGDQSGRPHSSRYRQEYSPGRYRTPTEVHYTPSGRLPPLTPSGSPRPVYVEGDEGGRRVRSPVTRISRSPRPGVEEDASGRVRHPSRGRSLSPTRVIVQSTAPPPPVVIRPPGSHYPHPETVPDSPTRVIRPPSIEPIVAERPTRVPSRRSERPPTVVPITPGRASPPLHDDEYYEDISQGPRHPSEYRPPVSEGRPIPPPPQSPRAAIRSQISGARDSEPVVPVIPSQYGRPGTQTMYPPPVQRIPESETYEDAVPNVHRLPRSPTPRPHPQTPSGPGDLALHDAVHAHQERLEEQERRLEELGRAEVDAEEHRERSFREHEEEREKLFRDNEGHRVREAAELRDEVREEVDQIIKEAQRIIEKRADSPSIGQPPIRTGELVDAEVVPPPTGGPGSIAGSDFSGSPSMVESVRPVPPPMQPIEPLPQLQEILDLLRAQQVECAEAKIAEAERFDTLRDEIAEARAEAKQECEERIRMLEDELARTREELELERGQRKSEELERIERERADVIERDEAVRAQLGDITNIVQEQREELARKRELMDERWAEKEMRRENKQMRGDAMYEMLERIIQDREHEREERELERAAAAERPSIEQVLGELRRMNEEQIELINNLTGEWRADSARQHLETIEAVRASAQEMVPYNLTGYLDEFSKALAGEIRTLLGEVGRLHEQKRGLQFEISTLMHVQSQYGPGGQFEPEWHPPPPPPVDMPPGGLGGPPPPDEPPPPARPAWRTVQQRAPRRRRTGKTEAPPAATLAPPEPMAERQQSWATWQPNPAFAPTPPPPGASPLVVPPQGPTGLFGPRSPRGTMYAG